ncbi:MAG: ATP-binding cassette domain-containing protein [Deltaproteobacteria bacterium]|nr:ATP-binding cassette domain-containing protein [Deltaproteobacteria bacterium]
MARRALGKSTPAQPRRGPRPASSGGVRVAGRTSPPCPTATSRRFARATSASSSSRTTSCPCSRPLENVRAAAAAHEAPERRPQAAAATALRVVGLEDRANHYPRMLSGGQEQRVAIARAIVNDPKIIVADEPTGDLDRKSADQILALLEKLNKDFKKTVVMVTHDPEAASHARVTHHLNKGAFQ